MNEAPILRSPHAYVPKRDMTEKEWDDLCKTRIDESYKPYTVIDVLTQVYHRNFASDLMQYVGEHPEEFIQTDSGWRMSRVFINHLKVIRSESVLYQDIGNFYVDILVESSIKIETTQQGKAYLKHRESANTELRLRYRFDFRPCCLICEFAGAVRDETKSLIAMDPYKITLDKYLIPYLTGDAYDRLATYLRKNAGRKFRDTDREFDVDAWTAVDKISVKQGVFPDDGILGEYFFGFGLAQIYNDKTGEVKKERIKPGTIIINKDIVNNRGMRNCTIVHETIHKILGKWFFLLQMTHGHDYCSYVCKRRSAEKDSHEGWNPYDIMEMQANKLLGHLMIPTTTGRLHALALLDSYGGESTLSNLRRLIADMAEYYGTTKTAARTRLIDFGFVEARGLLQSANGELIPSYVSELRDEETYTVSEDEAVKEYVENRNFRETLKSNRFVYAEGHYCLNDRKYVALDQFGKSHLTSYAREHMSECCLVFKRSHVNVFSRFVNGVLLKNTQGTGKRLQYVRFDGTPATTKEGLELRRRIEKDLADKAAVTMTFNQMTVALMKQKKMTIARLAEETGLSEETIKNMRNDPSRIFPIREIIAVCIGLHLTFDLSREYIRLSPSKIMNTTEMKLYEYALMYWADLPVQVVNRKLVECGAQPLTNDVDGFDEDGKMIEQA